MTLVIALMSDEEVARYGLNPDAGFGALDSARGRLPLTAMEVEARVAGVIAAIDVAQTFVNTTGGAIEATYIFPLPDRAAVHKFTMQVGDRVIDGAIDERGAARAAYDQALAAGHRAAITEEDRAGVFTLRVGNLMPGDAATVRLSLIGPLPIDDGEVTLRFPLVVAPRYIPGSSLGGAQAGLGQHRDTDLVPDASRISPPVRLPGWANPVRLGLRVMLTDGVVREVASSLHAVTEARRDAQVIDVVPGERLDRDFILRWRVDTAELRSQLVCAGDAAGGAFALTIIPPSTTSVAARPRDVVFLIDRSGSMEGWKMVAARRAVGRMIDSLTSRDRFSAIAFDDRAELIPAPRLVEASDRTRFRAIEALGAVESRGGTEIAQPLRLALGMLVGGTADRERMIVLVTDGQVGNEDNIVGELAPALRNIKMYTLGIDQAVNAAFLRRLAASGGGLCELVESEDRLDEVMAKVHRRIGAPIATELALRATGFAIDRASLAPAKLPDVYAGAPVVIFGRYRGPSSAAAVEVDASCAGEPLRLRVAATAAPAPASWVAASWARAHIRDLEDQYAVRPQPALAQQIAQVSKQFSVLSRFTAFVVVDRSQVVNAGGAVRQIVQPVESPAGWGMREPSVLSVLGGGPVSAGPPGSAGVTVSHVAAPMSAPLSARPSAGHARPFALSARDVGESGPPADDDFDQEMPSASMDGLRRRTPTAPSPRQPPPRPAPAAAGASEPLVPPVAYLNQLAELGRELAEAARLLQQSEHARAGYIEPLRRLRVRLAQWVEDARSSAGLNALADAVAWLLTRLTQLLAGPVTMAAFDAVAAIGAEAKRLAEDELRQRPALPSRNEFWK